MGGTPIKTLKPFQHPLTKRREKYLSSLSFKGDWIIAGGGPATALWHIGAEEPAQILESDNTVPFIILQADTRILLGGSDGSIHQFKNNGKQISTVATGSDIIYSLAESPSGMLTVEEIETQLMFTNITDTEPTKLFSKTA